MKITDDRAKDLLHWLDDMAGDHVLPLHEMARYRDAAALIRQLQAVYSAKEALESLLREAAALVRELDAAEQSAWHAGLDAGREQGRACGEMSAHHKP